MADSVTDHVACIILNAGMLKVESVWYLSFQEEHLSVDWSGNLDSSIGKSARLVICFESRFKFQVQIFLLKFSFINSTRHEIYGLNLNYKVRFHLIIIIDMNLTYSHEKDLVLEGRCNNNCGNSG